MNSKKWILVFIVLAIVCGGLSLWVLGGGKAESVEVWSDGELLYILPLAVDTEITVQTQRGTNTVTVRDGKAAVTQATCPDHYCMKRGFSGGGLQIVCLPNRLVLKFTAAQEIDGVVG